MLSCDAIPVGIPDAIPDGIANDVIPDGISHATSYATSYVPNFGANAASNASNSGANDAPNSCAQLQPNPQRGRFRVCAYNRVRTYGEHCTFDQLWDVPEQHPRRRGRR
jgi:hypothetical protein